MLGIEAFDDLEISIGWSKLFTYLSTYYWDYAGTSCHQKLRVAIGVKNRLREYKNRIQTISGVFEYISPFYTGQ